VRQSYAVQRADPAKTHKIKHARIRPVPYQQPQLPRGGEGSMAELKAAAPRLSARESRNCQTLPVDQRAPMVPKESKTALSPIFALRILSQCYLPRTPASRPLRAACPARATLLFLAVLACPSRSEPARELRGALQRPPGVISQPRYAH
jgi:hypothetical protein